MAGAVVGVGGALFVALIAGVWHLSGRLARIESKVDVLPSKDDVDAKIREHRQTCPAVPIQFHGETTNH